MKTGIIYKVISPSNKIYIGQTIEKLDERKSRHYRLTIKKTHKFARALQKYGDRLRWSILYENIPINQLNCAEICAIYMYDSYCIGYNSTLGGGGSIGNKHTQESRDKISKAGIGRMHSKETKMKMSESRKGKKQTKQTRKKLSKANSGDKNSMAKLSWSIVNEIRAKYKSNNYTHLELSKQFGVTRTAIQKIVNNKRWKI